MIAQELRIGNLVLVDNEVVKVESIDEIGINHLQEPYDDALYYAACFDEQRLKSIPITEDWLVKLGFTKGKHVSWEHEELDLTITHRGEFILLINKGEYEQGIPITYVHQLQNLYFALTGKELTYE